MTDQRKPDQPDDLDTLLPVAEQIAKSEPVDWEAEAHRTEQADVKTRAQL